MQAGPSDTYISINYILDLIKSLKFSYLLHKRSN